MKELLSFAFAVLFIACQSQPFPETKMAPPIVAPQKSFQTSMNSSELLCETSEKTSWDLAQELTHATEPGIHDRRPTIRTEKNLVASVQLKCSSGLSEWQSSPAAAEDVLFADNLPGESSKEWDVLVQRWTYVSEARTYYSSR